MIEKGSSHTEQHEQQPERQFQVTIVGAACSGKSTLLRSLRDEGYTINPEPDNPVFPLFLENPKKYAYRNQLHKTTQLMEQEILDTKSDHMSNPNFRESGVLATYVYNQYLFDQGFMTPEQNAHLNWLYDHHLASFPTPDLVVYLYAPDDVIKGRAVKRDGLVAHDPHSLQPYWDRLLTNLGKRQIPVLRVNTGERQVNETKQIILQEVERLKAEKKGTPIESRALNFKSSAFPQPTSRLYKPE